uniref:Ig-like domain-containing protein n=1 Tax=Mola mola TaxID=94237 RepID=A0A3Q3WEA1_MOLML
MKVVVEVECLVDAPLHISVHPQWTWLISTASKSERQTTCQIATVILIEISFRQPHQCEYSTHWTGNFVTPDRSQFFRYETISLTCAAPANSSGLSVRRNTSFQTSKVCGIGWGVMAKTSCNIENAYQSDTGEYWCESPQGGCSNKVNITVTAAAVILESPALPVMEGDAVTLRCALKEENKRGITSDFSAAFYKDSVFIRNEPARRMILPAVSKSDEGFYKCKHPINGTSLQSLLAVTGDSASTAPHLPPLMTLPRLLCTILIVIIYLAIFILCVYMYRLWAQGEKQT